MLSIDTIVGHVSDPCHQDRLHHIDHHGGLDIVTIAPEDLARRRLRAVTDAGRELAIALPRDQKLAHGALLLLTHDQAIMVRAGAQSWLRLTPASSVDAIELGYHAGNLHWKVRFDGASLLVCCVGDAQSYLDRIRTMVESGRVAVANEVG